MQSLVHTQSSTLARDGVRAVYQDNRLASGRIVGLLHEQVRAPAISEEPAMANPTPTAELSLAHVIRPAQATEPSSRPPLLLLLHGVGSNEYDLFRRAPQLDARFLVVSARAPVTREPGSYAWFTVRFTADGFIIDAQQLEASRKRLITFIGEAVRAYKADPARVYLMGFSQGAIMSLTLALTEPYLVGGIVALAGRIPPEVLPWLTDPTKTTGLPVFLAHGRADTVIPFHWAERARETLNQQRVALTFRAYETDHQIPPAMLADANAWIGACLDAAPWSPPAN